MNSKILYNQIFDDLNEILEKFERYRGCPDEVLGKEGLALEPHQEPNMPITALGQLIRHVHAIQTRLPM